MTCPLCAQPGAWPFHRDRRRSYYRCEWCALVFVPPAAWPDVVSERARYDQHQNDPSDARYRRFLARLTEPLLERVRPGSSGLDFGSGPGPTLPVMLREAGLQVDLFDPFYAPNTNVWRRRYAFVTASEVAEHLRDPAGAFQRLFDVIEPGGWLAVMTKWVHSRDDFASWRYIRDPTHIVFYCPKTLRWIATRWNATVDFVRQDVALFRTVPTPEAERRVEVSRGSIS